MKEIATTREDTLRPLEDYIMQLPSPSINWLSPTINELLNIHYIDDLSVSQNCLSITTYMLSMITLIFTTQIS